jgi:hypothetical protein
VPELVAPGLEEPGRRLRGEVAWLVALAVAGVGVGVAWRLLAGPVVRASDATEAAAAADGALALLGVLAGFATALLLLARLGPRPALRVLVVLAGACAAGALSWATGALLGAPRLRAPAAAFAWPAATALLTCIVTSLRVLTARG